jgi:hypothetical protein
VGAAIESRLALEDGADDDGDGSVGRATIKASHAPGPQVQDLADARTHQVGEDDVASCIEHVDALHELGHRWHRPLDVRPGIAGAPQRPRRLPGVGVAVEARRGGRTLSVDLSGMQDLGGVIGHDVHGGLKQCDRHGVGGVGPGTMQPLAIAGSLVVAAAWERIDLQAIVQVGAKAIEVGEQVQMPLHRRRRSQRSPGRGEFPQPTLKLQKCRCIQIGKANEPFMVHPAHQETQREEIVQYGTRPQRQSGAQ